MRTSLGAREERETRAARMAWHSPRIRLDEHELLVLKVILGRAHRPGHAVPA